MNTLDVNQQIASFGFLSRQVMRLNPYANRIGRIPLIDTRRFEGEENRLALCVSELEQLHLLINWYDNVVMNKKSWFIAVWSFLSAYALHHADATIMWLGLAVIVGFAMSELVLRRYQRRYVVRAEEVEETISSGDLSRYQFSLARTPAYSHRGREIWYAVMQPHFTLFYSFFAVNSVAYALLF